MAQQRKIKVNLAEFEETQERKNAATHERSNAETQTKVTNQEERDNAVTQERSNAETQTNIANEESNTETQKRSDAGMQKRKKSIPRTNGQTYYIEERHKKSLKRISANNDIDMQDVVRTAIDTFLEKYLSEDGHELTTEGLEEVRKYLERLEKRI